MTGKPRSLELMHTRDYLQLENDHLEIRSVTPRDAPHPLSATGYLSHFIDPGELKARVARSDSSPIGSPRNKSRSFIAAEQKRLQGDLFSWADRHAATRPKQRPSSPRVRGSPNCKTP